MGLSERPLSWRMTTLDMFFFFIITCWYKHDNGIDMEERKLKYGKQK